MNKNYIKEYLSDHDLNAITGHIADIEKYTSGEIRICLKEKKGFLNKNTPAKILALKEFHKLGMHKTKDKTGVLLYILFTDRQFEIIADEGINSKINDEKWIVITGHLIKEFKGGNYKTGIIKALDEIKEVLHNEFPKKDNDENELSNDIVIE